MDDFETFTLVRPATHHSSKNNRNRSATTSSGNQPNTRNASRTVINPLQPVLEGRAKDVTTYNSSTVIYAQHPEVLTTFLAHDVNVLSHNSMALRVACKMGAIETARRLLEAGCDPSANNNEALIWAAENGYDDVVLLLMRQYNTDPSANKNAALRLATLYKHSEVIDVLRSDVRVSGLSVDQDPDTLRARELIY
jgi:ankyrin repeat protein